MKKQFVLLFLIFISTIFLNSQTSKDVDCKLLLRDGNNIIGKTNISSINFLTDYGKLEIPIANITSVKFGIVVDKSVEKTITDLINGLNNQDETIRKDSYEKISKYGIMTISILENYILSDKYKESIYQDYNINGLLEDLKLSYNIQEGLNNKDEVTINDKYLINGVYDIKIISVTTEYGVLNIPREKIDLAEFYAQSKNQQTNNFTLIASKNISCNANGGWLKTGIMVKKGTKIQIVSTGEIILQSLSGNKYKPDGSVNGAAPANAEYINYGVVAFKIGEGGTTISAGAKYSGVAQNSGMLYISIYETVYNSNNTGSYNVKITVE